LALRYLAASSVFLRFDVASSSIVQPVDARGDLTAASLEHRERPVADPVLCGRIVFGEEAPCIRPQIFQRVAGVGLRGTFSFGPDPGGVGTVGCGNTASNYCSKAMDKLALAVHFTSGSEAAAVHAVENFAAEQLCYIFLPLDAAPTYEISKHLGGFEYEPGEAVGAGYYGWYITK
jgi:hypothetical protein